MLQYKHHVRSRINLLFEKGDVLLEFYIGWSHSDAIFCDYFPQCPVLISAIPDNRGSIKKYKNKPKRLILDCGSVFYVKQKIRPPLKDVFDIQISLLEDCGKEAIVQMVHFDEPLLNKSSLSERYMAIERTLFNAYEYFNIFQKYKLPKSVQPMGVIQGYDQASIEFSAYELTRMGYTKFGIGSLLFKHHTQQIEMIKRAADVVGPSNLHVFGVTGIPQLSAMVDIGVSSFDSTRPTMAAVFFQVFYSRPFRTFFLPESRAKPTSPRLVSPLHCECPVCENDAKQILIPSPREYMKLRSIHNYYHLLRTFNDILENKKRSGEHVVSNVLWTGN